MEVSKQFPMLKEQLLYKLEEIALHEERRLEESTSVLAVQVKIQRQKTKTKARGEAACGERLGSRLTGACFTI